MSANEHYDESLLASAPKVTKAELQEGYNVDLLNEGAAVTGSKSSLHATPPPQVPALARSIEQDPESVPQSEKCAVQAPKKKPFWRSRTGAIIIFVLVLVVIGAVVGGAVGGTQGHHHSSSASTNSSSGQQSTNGTNPSQSSGGQQGSQAGGGDSNSSTQGSGHS